MEDKVAQEYSPKTMVTRKYNEKYLIMCHPTRPHGRPFNRYVWNMIVHEGDRYTTKQRILHFE